MNRPFRCTDAIISFDDKRSNILKSTGIFSRLGGHAGLFFKGRNPDDNRDSLNAPVTLKYYLSTGGKKAVSGTDLLWGCSQMNFKANPPFNEMRQGFATFKKETRMPQYLPVLFEMLPKGQAIFSIY